jgi:MoxR-like ATPase
MEMAARQLQRQNTPTRTAVRKVTKTSAGLVTVPEEIFYVGRQIAGRSDFETFDWARSHGKNVLLEGPTGPGKTTGSEAYAASRHYPFYAVPSYVGIEPSELFGKFIPDGKGGFVWQDGPIPQLVRHGGVLLINEINFLPDRVSTVLFSLLDSRRQITLLSHGGEVIRAHRPTDPRTGRKCWCDLSKKECEEHWLLIIADMNPDYAGTRTLNAALRNRFGVQLNWDYDDAVEAALIKSEPLRHFMKRLRSDVATEVYTTPVSTNMGMEFEEIAGGLGYDFAVLNFVNHFAVDERESIVKLFEADRDNIEPTINVKEETEEEKYERRLRMKIGDVDPEWGVYGTNWVWPEDRQMVEVEEVEV